ncbi:histidine phosphatase family protein [Neobacillus sp. PS3-40]|uniref:histidine phosphatase family protein n=1 Tax=Neobacillus sp. PS3-40 TaxID=3070679 RepID=UPI0027DEE196|nr:histidine phosphatase family protein [Neobacillus sp. PS3-40]WML44878.1 histidine phosphatase family protein [Neobacillus sp. PS3-40]
MSTHLYLTRHGETIWNTKNVMQGWKDSPLTDKGVKQAMQLADRLSTVSLDAIYSSTSERAINTAEIIKRGRPIEVIKLNSLRELSFGIWEGKTFDENEKATPEQWFTFWEKPHLFSSDTVESFKQVQERMVNTIESIVKAHPSENICIVTHSIALKLLMHYFEKIPLEKLWSTPAIPSTSLSLVKISEGINEFLLKYDTSHL